MGQVNEDEIIKLLSNRKNSIDPYSLKEIYSNDLSDGLKALIAERLGTMEKEGWEVIRILLKKYGVQSPLIKAAGISHQDGSREFLLDLLLEEESNDYNIEIYESLACWGASIPSKLIEKIIKEPSKRAKLAGLELLSFKAHLMTNNELLNAMNEIFDDFRDEILIKVITILQRRDGEEIVSKLKDLVISGSSITSEKAISALGCIRSQNSKTTLETLVKILPQGRNLELVQKQLAHNCIQ